MGKVSIKRVPLKVQELKKLRDVIYKELEKNINIQIFVEKSLYDEIKFNYFDYNMEPTEVETSGHYSNYAQNFYELQNAKGHYEGKIGFTAHNSDYMQVTIFKMDRFNYVHYNCGMQKILEICEYQDQK